MAIDSEKNSFTRFIFIRQSEACEACEPKMQSFELELFSYRDCKKG